MMPPYRICLPGIRRHYKEGWRSLENSEIDSGMFGSFMCDADGGHALCDKDTGSMGFASGREDSTLQRQK